MVLKSKLLPLIVVLSVFWTATIYSSADTVEKKPCEATVIDVPVLRIGDTWSYHQNLWYNGSNFWVHLIEDFTFTVNSIEPFYYRGYTSWGYNLTISGSIAGGEGKYQQYDVDVRGGTISGYKFLKMSDLGFTIDKWYRYAQIKVTYGIGSLSGELWLDYALIPEPAVEEMDFKVTAGEIFYANMTMRAVGYFKYKVPPLASGESPFDDTSVVNQQYTCHPITSIAGYDCHYLHDQFIGAGGGTKQWYNSTVKQNVREDWYDLPYVGGGSATIDYVRLLTSYSHAAPPTTTITEQIEPEIAEALSVVNISGTVTPAPAPGTTIIAKMPEQGYQWSTTTDQNGNYLFQITAPFVADNTPTSYDIGSFGIVVAIQGLETTVYTVSTLTITSPYRIATVNLQPGWNFVSLPLAPANEDLTEVLKSISGNYDIVEWYDAFSEPHWKTFAVTKPSYLNTLTHLNISMGFWINITSVAPVQLVVTGLPVADISIPLSKGWNMVGYPLSECTVSTAIQNILQYKPLIYGFDENAPYNLRKYTDTDLLKTACGYWLYVNDNCVWQLP